MVYILHIIIKESWVLKYAFSIFVVYGFCLSIAYIVCPCQSLDSLMVLQALVKSLELWHIFLRCY